MFTFASYCIHRIILELIITAIIFKLIIKNQINHEIHIFVLSVCMSTISSGFRRSWSSGWNFRIVTYANDKRWVGSSEIQRLLDEEMLLSYFLLLFGKCMRLIWHDHIFSWPRHLDLLPTSYGIYSTRFNWGPLATESVAKSSKHLHGSLSRTLYFHEGRNTAWNASIYKLTKKKKNLISVNVKDCK